MFIFFGVDATAARDVRAYRSRSAHSRSSSPSRFQSIGPPTTSGDEDMNFDEDKEEDDVIELAPPQRQVSVSEVCLFHSFLYTKPDIFLNAETSSSYQQET